MEPVDSGDPLAKIRNVLPVESDPRRERPAFQPLFSRRPKRFRTDHTRDPGKVASGVAILKTDGAQERCNILILVLANLEEHGTARAEKPSCRMAQDTIGV